MRRIARAVVTVLVAVSLLAGFKGLDLRLAHERAPMVLTAVRAPGGEAVYQPGRWPTPVFMLAVGSDGRAGLDGERGDALHVIGLNPVLGGAATIINIPRDTWVRIPGHGEGRINQAYHFGGPQLQAETVRQLTGIPIGFVLTTTFDGLVAMVDRLDGVEVDIPFAMDDQNSGAAFLPGRQRLTGSQALAFSRNRHIPDGDLRRTGHQGQLIIHALAELQRDGRSATDTLRYLEVLYRTVRVDGVDPANVRNYTMPARLGFVGRASVVFVHPAAGSLFADMADDAILQTH